MEHLNTGTRCQIPSLFFMLASTSALIAIEGCDNSQETPPLSEQRFLPPFPRSGDRSLLSPPQPDHDSTSSDRGHHATSTPIDCPLHKAGVATGDLRPFEDVEAYIAFLERADRAAWQKPDEVVRALDLTGTETIADVGAGSGYFTFRLASAVPRGRVVAVEIEPEMVRHIHHKAQTDEIDNVETVLVTSDEVEAPKGADLVFVCDVLHHVADREAWLERLFQSMRPGARLALIEFKEGELPEGPPAEVKIPRAELIRLAEGAGFTFEAEETELLPYQVFLTFVRSTSRSPR